MDKVLPPLRKEYRVLTCIMPASQGSQVREALRSETGVINTMTHHARGIGTHNLRHRLFADEKQILTVLVEAERADEVFRFLYYSAGLDTPHAGMIMMGREFRGAGVVAPSESEDGASVD